MKQLTSLSPCLTFTHSRCRGDFSSRALAQSCAETLKEASTIATPIVLNALITLLRRFRSRFKVQGSTPKVPLSLYHPYLTAFPNLTDSTQSRPLFRRQSQHDIETRRQFPRSPSALRRVHSAVPPSRNTEWSTSRGPSF